MSNNVSQNMPVFNFCHLLTLDISIIILHNDNNLLQLAHYFSILMHNLQGNYHESMTFSEKSYMCSHEKDEIYGKTSVSGF